MFRSKLEEKLGDKTENPSMVVQITETKPLSRSLQTHHLAEISKNQHSLRRAQRGKGESYTAELKSSITIVQHTYMKPTETIAPPMLPLAEIV